MSVRRDPPSGGRCGQSCAIVVGVCAAVVVVAVCAWILVLRRRARARHKAALARAAAEGDLAMAPRAPSHLPDGAGGTVVVPCAEFVSAADEPGRAALAMFANRGLPRLAGAFGMDAPVPRAAELERVFQSRRWEGRLLRRGGVCAFEMEMLPGGGVRGAGRARSGAFGVRGAHSRPRVALTLEFGGGAHAVELRGYAVVRAEDEPGHASVVLCGLGYAVAERLAGAGYSRARGRPWYWTAVPAERVAASPVTRAEVAEHVYEAGYDRDASRVVAEYAAAPWADAGGRAVRVWLPPAPTRTEEKEEEEEERIPTPAGAAPTVEL